MSYRPESERLERRRCLYCDRKVSLHCSVFQLKDHS